MQKKIFRGIIWSMLAVFFLSALIIGATDVQKSERQEETLKFTGEYHLEGDMTWKPLEETGLNHLTGIETVYLRGHLSESILEGKDLTIRNQNMRVEILVNGVSIYKNVEPISKVSRSNGNGWTIVPSPGITTEDEVEFILTNVYATQVNECFEKFLNNLYGGNGSTVLLREVKQSWYGLVISVLILAAGAVLILVSFVVGDIDKIGQQLLELGFMKLLFFMQMIQKVHCLLSLHFA